MCTTADVYKSKLKKQKHKNTLCLRCYAWPSLDEDNLLASVDVADVSSAADAIDDVVVDDDDDDDDDDDSAIAPSIVAAVAALRMLLVLPALRLRVRGLGPAITAAEARAFATASRRLRPLDVSRAIMSKHCCCTTWIARCVASSSSS